MKVNSVTTGYLEENCYILEDNENNVLIVDPGDDFDKIDKMLSKKNVLKVLITHHHFDHVGALEDVLSKYKVEVIDSEKVDKYKLKNFEFEVINTPGHTSDSVSFYFPKEKIMFTGDFLFKNSIGRCDLPTGSEYKMSKSINLIKKYDKDIKIYPGHGESSILKNEFKNNIYLK